MIAAAVYILCAVTSGLCALLLVRMYTRARSRMLVWCTLSFAGWAISNAFVFLDLVVLPDVDLSLVRAVAAVASTSLLLVGLIWYGD